jgi:hypothetical protein
MKPVRCGNSRPTPYLRRHLPGIPKGASGFALDLGAGNLRNTVFARSLGWHVLPLDAAGDNGSLRCDIGSDRLPVADGSVDLFLCNYVLCFLCPDQRRHLVSEINRSAGGGAHVAVEMYEARKAFPYDTSEIAGSLGCRWRILRKSKDRFIARMRLLGGE